MKTIKELEAIYEHYYNKGAVRGWCEAKAKLDTLKDVLELIDELAQLHGLFGPKFLSVEELKARITG